jgi:general secretion pathway protein G
MVNETNNRVISRPGLLGSRAFTLVEILIVVVILGILAAMVVPQFAQATDDSRVVATKDQLEKIKKALSVYFVQNNSQYPTITAGDGTWGEIITRSYMRTPPVNSWVGGSGSKTIILGSSPDSAYQTTHGWIYNAATGDVLAGSFDAGGEPLPR